MYTLDETDLQILRALQENSRLSNKELAAKIHLSTTPTFERHRRLEREGFIRQYTAIIDAGRLERNFHVYCSVGFKQINQRVADDFRGLVESWNEVTECYNVSGEGDFMLKVCVGSMRQYQQFLMTKLGVVDYVSRIQSVFVMDTLKQSYSIPL